MRFLLAMVSRHLAADMKSRKLVFIRLFLQPAIYLLVFGHVVGKHISPAGTDYAEILAPGVVAIAVMSGPFSIVGGSMLSGYYFRILEGWLLAPVTLRTLMATKIVCGLLYGTASAITVALLAWGILGVAPNNFGLLCLIVATGSLFFSLLILTLLTIPGRPDKGQEIFSLFMTPMAFFGCTFYSYAMLEPPFRYVALFLPTTYISEGLRAAYNPASSHIGTVPMVVGLLAATAVLFPLADWAFRRRLRDFLW